MKGRRPCSASRVTCASGSTRPPAWPHGFPQHCSTFGTMRVDNGEEERKSLQSLESGREHPQAGSRMGAKPGGRIQPGGGTLSPLHRRSTWETWEKTAEPWRNMPITDAKVILVKATPVSERSEFSPGQDTPSVRSSCALAGSVSRCGLVYSGSLFKKQQNKEKQKPTEWGMARIFQKWQKEMPEIIAGVVWWIFMGTQWRCKMYFIQEDLEEIYFF